ncbi:MAG TPA: hypothetical protein VMQ76_02285, partial [Terracidiphilus sp.]|nr:hypothetical protein [Terracidiphilus sp.]
GISGHQHNGTLGSSQSMPAKTPINPATHRNASRAGIADGGVSSLGGNYLRPEFALRSAVTVTTAGYRACENTGSTLQRVFHFGPFCKPYFLKWEVQNLKRQTTGITVVRHTREETKDEKSICFPEI